MKPDKYEQLRALLSNYLGSPALRIIKDNMAALDMDPEVFDLVYEGFWDLYTFHPKIRDNVSARKLQGWIQKIRLQSGPDRSPAVEEEEPAAAEGEEEEVKSASEVKPSSRGMDLQEEDIIDPVAAVVRLKIPKVPREPELDEDGNPIEVEVPESDLEDIPFEDRCLQIVSKSED